MGAATGRQTPKAARVPDDILLDFRTARIASTVSPAGRVICGGYSEPLAALIGGGPSGGGLIGGGVSGGGPAGGTSAGRGGGGSGGVISGPGCGGSTIGGCPGPGCGDSAIEM